MVFACKLLGRFYQSEYSWQNVQLLCQSAIERCFEHSWLFLNLELLNFKNSIIKYRMFYFFISCRYKPVWFCFWIYLDFVCCYIFFVSIFFIFCFYFYFLILYRYINMDRDKGIFKMVLLNSYHNSTSNKCFNNNLSAF